jgi:endo-1,4-beta-xylanase
MQGKRIKQIGLVIFFIGCITVGTVWYMGYFDKPAEYNITLEKNLKDAAKIPIGAAVDSYNLENNSAYRAIVIQHFNSIVAEWQMKMSSFYKQLNAFEWYHFDYLVNFAIENNMTVHGHTLLWHESTPKWVEDFNGTDAEFEQMIKTYIQTVVTRYKGKIATWDVVNEAFDGPKYRKTVFYDRLGKDYIKKAFQWAHEADPEAKLYYNDFSMLDYPEKVDFIIQEIGTLVNQSVPIHGIGIQGHLLYDWPGLTLINQSLAKWNQFGLDIRISEMDIAMNYEGQNPVFSQKVAEMQKQRYYDVVTLYLKCPKLTGITLWGVTDAHTWIPDHHGHVDWPLLFDAELKPKPAAEGFLAALLEAN